MPRLQHASELPLEFTPLQLAPGSALFAEPFRARASLLARPALQAHKRSLHLNRVPVPVCRVELNRPRNISANSGMTRFLSCSLPTIGQANGHSGSLPENRRYSTRPSEKTSD
jgi:hypothetical protein